MSPRFPLLLGCMHVLVCVGVWVGCVFRRTGACACAHVCCGPHGFVCALTGTCVLVHACTPACVRVHRHMCPCSLVCLITAGGQGRTPTRHATPAGSKQQRGVAHRLGVLGVGGSEGDFHGHLFRPRDAHCSNRTRAQVKQNGARRGQGCDPTRPCQHTTWHQGPLAASHHPKFHTYMCSCAHACVHACMNTCVLVHVGSGFGCILKMSRS